jgi:hypothetical protein
VANIVAVVTGAAESDIEAGKAWYAVYRRQIVRQAKRHGLTPEQGLALFAVLSQQTALLRNWTNYLAVVTTKDPDQTVGTWAAMRAKCRAILADAANPGQYATGPKISSFYKNLAGDQDTVTVDRHAISACFNQMINEVGSKYTYVAECYRVAAAMVGLTPAQTQAVAWLAWRRMKGIVDTEVA